MRAKGEFNGFNTLNKQYVKQYLMNSTCSFSGVKQLVSIARKIELRLKPWMYQNVKSGAATQK